MDSLLSAVSHELRTPLNAILGWARMLRSGQLPDDQRDKALEIIERNAVAQARLIQDILDASRLMSDRLSIDEQDVDFAAIVRSAIERVQPAASARGVTLETKLATEVPSMRGDADRLLQVATHLIDNAVKFSARGGRVEVRLEAKDDVVELTVSDHGEGVDPKVLPYLFQLFRHGDRGEATRRRGLGLGLSIAHKLVALHGGHTEAHSAGKGHGATFVVKLPTRHDHATVAPDAPVPPAEGSAPLSGLSILVVDDDSDARELLVSVLGTAGAQVSTASSAAEAMTSFKKKPPALFICDIGLPEADGYQVVREIRKLPPTQGGRVPAIALTGFASREDRVRALVEGFNVHVAKPIEPNELIIVAASLCKLAEA